MAERRYPTRDEIEKAEDRSWEDVPAPELGADCYVRVGSITAAERIEFERAVAAADPSDAYALLLARSVVDPATGTRMFTDEDVAWLKRKDWRWTARASQAAIRFNGIDALTIETYAKN